MSRISLRLPRRVGVGAIALALLLSTPSIANAASTDWPTYHRDNARDGHDSNAGSFHGPMLRKWTSASLGGTIYAEPLLVGNLVIVADIGDTITALNADTGAIVWQTKVGNSVSRTNPPFPCGDINPLGIIGTPVVDPAAGIVYAVAMEQPANYYLVGLDLQTGVARFPQVAIAPTGFDPHIQQQRAALSLANGYVYVAFGGFAGDCGPYHGWVVGVPASGSGTQVIFHTNPTGSTATEAGIWTPSGLSIDGSGNLYVTSGNGGSCGGSFDNGNTIFKLNATVGLVDWWVPSVWNSLNCTDDDLGSVAPIIVGTSGNLIFQTGKPGWGYLLNTALSSPGGHYGNEPFSAQVCSAATSQSAANGQVFGGLAYADPYIYVPCPEGIVALKLGPGLSFSHAWTSASIHPGPPIVGGGIVWAINTSNGSLYGLDPRTGATRFGALSLGSSTRFGTPTYGRAQVYVPIGNQVIAFGPRELPIPVAAASSSTRGPAPPPVPQVPPGPRRLHPVQ